MAPLYPYIAFPNAIFVYYFEHSVSDVCACMCVCVRVITHNAYTQLMSLLTLLSMVFGSTKLFSRNAAMKNHQAPRREKQRYHFYMVEAKNASITQIQLQCW